MNTKLTNFLEKTNPIRTFLTFTYARDRPEPYI